MSEIPLLNRMLVRVQIATRLRRMLDQADLHITVSRLVMLALLAGLMAGLPKDTWIRLIIWLVLGFFVYFGYSRSHSLIGRGGTAHS